MTTQIANSAERDVIGTQTNITNVTNLSPPVLAQKSQMTFLIEKFLSEKATDKTTTEFIQKLQHYLSNETVADIRSLEEKLKSSDREDQIKDATLKKQNAAKFILKNQNSIATQNIMVHILSDIAINFDHKIMPLIQSGQTRQIVDFAVLEHVIAPIYHSLETNPLDFNKANLQEFLYFLAGNCHIRWDLC